MNIQDFKQSLLEGTLTDELIIFVNSENSFLADSYVDEICKQKNLSRNYVTSLASTVSSALALVMSAAAELNILKVDVFDEALDAYTSYNNCVVICNKISPEIETIAKEYIIKIPKLKGWQVKDYIEAVCPGLTKGTIDWLYDACCGDIYKIANESSTLSICDQADRETLISKIRQDKASDLFIKESVFKLVDALIYNNKECALDFLLHADYYTRPYISSAGTKERDLDPIGLVSLLLQKYKNILLLNFRSGLTEEQLGLSKGAIWHLRNETRNISLQQITKAINFLSSIDTKLKANPSKLDFIDCRSTALLEYVIIGTLACCE